MFFFLCLVWLGFGFGCVIFCLCFHLCIFSIFFSLLYVSCLLVYVIFSFFFLVSGFALVLVLVQCSCGWFGGCVSVKMCDNSESKL